MANMYLLRHLASQRGRDDDAVSTVYDPVMDGQFISVVEIRQEVLRDISFEFWPPFHDGLAEADKSIVCGSGTSYFVHALVHHVMCYHVVYDLLLGRIICLCSR